MAHWNMSLQAIGPKEKLEDLNSHLFADEEWSPSDEGYFEDETDSGQSKYSVSWDDVSGDLGFYVKKFKTELEEKFEGVSVHLLFDSMNGYGIYATEDHPYGKYVIDYEYFETFEAAVERFKSFLKSSFEEYDIDQCEMDRIHWDDDPEDIQEVLEELEDEYDADLCSKFIVQAAEDWDD